MIARIPGVQPEGLQPLLILSGARKGGGIKAVLRPSLERQMVMWTEGIGMNDVSGARGWATTVSPQVPSARIQPLTPWAWHVAWLPTTPLVAALSIIVSLHTAVPLSLVVGMAAISQLLSFGAAAVDADRLKQRGVTVVASPLWALLLPGIYLWRRARPFKEQYSGLGPFWLNFFLMPPVILNSFFWASFTMIAGGQ